MMIAFFKERVSKKCERLFLERLFVSELRC